ncbi:efflux RND transporter periplasmic adaptor subunit [Acinetobacter baumannii]
MNLLKPLIMSMMIVCMVTLTGCSKEAPKTEEIPYVMVTQPSTTLHEQKSYAGDVQARQQTALAFRVGGQVTARYVDVGDRVRVGQVLAKLDVADAQLQLNAAKAQLENAQAAAKTASDELKRFQQLLPINAVSRSQYDTVKNQYDAAQAALQQARSNYEVSANQTGYNQLVSNKNGVIIARNIEIGQVVAAGQAAWITLWSKPNERFAGYVREVSPAADQSRTFTVKVALKEGQSAIQLGQSARVFFSSTQTNVMSVPLSSVSATDNQPYVWVVNANQTLRKVPVTIGAYGRDSVPVLSGLTPNDWVVIGGVHLLRDKQKIHPIDRENRAVKIQGAK